MYIFFKLLRIFATQLNILNADMDEPKSNCSKFIATHEKLCCSFFLLNLLKIDFEMMLTFVFNKIVQHMKFRAFFRLLFAGICLFVEFWMRWRVKYLSYSRAFDGIWESRKNNWKRWHNLNDQMITFIVNTNYWISFKSYRKF